MFKKQDLKLLGLPHSTRGEYVCIGLGAILGLLFFYLICGQVWGADVDAWWNPNYDHRKLFFCGNHDEYSTNDFLHIIGVDVTGAKFMDNGNDIRIVRQTTSGQTDLGRYLIGANTSSAQIYWKVQATIPADENIGGEDDYKIYMYYGYSSAGSPPTYVNTVCIDAPYTVDGNTVALYRFEDADTVYDETANNNDGKGEGGVTYEAAGKFDNCLDYDGTDDYVWVDWYVADPPVSAMTIDFWVYPQRDSQTIMSFCEVHPASGAWDRGFALDGDGTVRWKVYDGADYVAVSTTSPSINTWFHVAGVIDETIGADSGVILYINGAAEDTTLGCDGGYMGYSDVEFLMGNSRESGWGLGYDFLAYFDGKIDEVRISDVTRTNFHHVTNEATLSLGSEGMEGKISLYPVGNVTPVEWLQYPGVGAWWEKIDEAIPDGDVTYLYEDSSDEQYGCTQEYFMGTGRIDSVRLEIVGRSTSAGSSDLVFGRKTYVISWELCTDDAGVDTVTFTTDYDSYGITWINNPCGGDPWIKSELNEAAVRKWWIQSCSLSVDVQLRVTRLRVVVYWTPFSLQKIVNKGALMPIVSKGDLKRLVGGGN